MSCVLQKSAGGVRPREARLISVDRADGGLAPRVKAREGEADVEIRVTAAKP